MFLLKKIFKILFFILIIAIIIVIVNFRLYEKFNYKNITEIKQFFIDLKILPPVIIILLYIAFSLACLSTVQFAFISGYLYGPIWGSILAIVGMIIGMNSAFYGSRYLFRDSFQKRFGDNKIVKEIDGYAKKYKGKAVLILRTFSVFPYNLQNIAYGLSSINGFSHFWGSSIGIIPFTFFFVWTGSIIDTITPEEIKIIFLKFGIVSAMLTAIIITTFIIKTKIISKKREEGNEH